MSETEVKVLFVCTGNICRSPTAEGVFRHLVAQEGLATRVSADSAGTIDYHAGHPPDDRAQEAALRRGVDLSALRARQVERSDFTAFDYLVAMDEQNRTYLLRHCPPELRHKVCLFLEFGAGRRGAEVPDPYYGGALGFEHVLDLCEAASKSLLAHIRDRQR